MFTDVSELKDKKIMIVGLAKCGVSLVRFLAEHGAKVTVSDHKSKPELSHFLEQIEEFKTIDYDLGGHTPKKFIEQDLIEPRCFATAQDF